MDESRLERVLRQGPPWETAYRPRLDHASFTAPARRRGTARLPWSAATGALRLVAASAVVVLVVGAFLWFRQPAIVTVGTSPSPSEPGLAPSGDPSPAGSGDLLGQVRAAGALRLAIRPDFPQATIAGLEGFDVDVATVLAGRLTLSPHPVQLSPSDMLSGEATDPWDLALPSAPLPAAATARFATSSAYYYWPAWLIVPEAAAAATPADLAGATICVTGGSSGEAWLAGRLDPGTGSAASPPPTPTIRTEATDWACLDALTRGEVDALVTASLSKSDLAARPSLRTVGGPLFIEPRAIVAARAGPDPSALLAAIDDALDAMRSDGTLADLSRNRFGGRDLTTPPTTS